MAGMRDKLIHDYFGIDYDIVWDIIENKVPDLDHFLNPQVLAPNRLRFLLLLRDCFSHPIILHVFDLKSFLINQYFLSRVCFFRSTDFLSRLFSDDNTSISESFLLILFFARA